MSTAQAISQPAQPAKPAHQRKISNAIWQPFLQFKLLIYMLGSTAIVACLLAVFLYYAFSDLIGAASEGNTGHGYYADMIEIQLVHLFRYCGALFVLYILLLATVCVAYTHKLIGPFRPLERQVDAMLEGDYSQRVILRKGDVEMFTNYAKKLNKLTERLEDRPKS